MCMIIVITSKKTKNTTKSGLETSFIATNPRRLVKVFTI